MVFRIVVREIEAWLMADAEALSRFLAVPLRSIPADPEQVPDPKETLVDLARSSRRREIREDLVPRPGSGRAVGPGYTATMLEFTHTVWRPAVAAARCGGVAMCLARMREVAERFR
jgi:hypothetical protein